MLPNDLTIMTLILFLALSTTYHFYLINLFDPNSVVGITEEEQELIQRAEKEFFKAIEKEVESASLRSKNKEVNDEDVNGEKVNNQDNQN